MGAPSQEFLTLALYIRVPEVVRKRLARSKARKEQKDAKKVELAKVWLFHTSFPFPFPLCNCVTYHRLLPLNVVTEIRLEKEGVLRTC